MSRRQAGDLAIALGEAAGVTVRPESAGVDAWDLRWADGPTLVQMRVHLAAVLDTGRFDAMRDRRITLLRGTTCRAWAARAIASRRAGTLAQAVASGPRRRGRTLPDSASDEQAQAALHRHVHGLLEATAWPQRADVPADEEPIAALLAAGTRSRYGDRPTCTEQDMAHALLGALIDPDAPGAFR
ncbi:hypothetical protein [Streptomyces avicenniae]|uniref:hypothetical protein n=1 Tax=Streptomyces avicenniae TaxID=500153 RepID=UPI000AF647F0|nr:hypothetical protein [Streptomyces avicenniae]